MTVESMRKWLDSCPVPVIARVLSEQDDIEFLSSSSFIYEKGMLVVIELQSLKTLLENKADYPYG